LYKKSEKFSGQDRFLTVRRQAGPASGTG